MVAIFTGNGLGLFNSPVGAGSTRLGQSRDSFSINVATGNLVLLGFDEGLVARGLGAAAVRTYNSRGQLSDAGQDAWVTGYERRVILNGTLGAAGSSVSVQRGDGSVQTFWNVAGTTSYASAEGEGAHDTLRWDAAGSVWRLVEGSSRREEVYANHADALQSGRLLSIRDLRSDGATPAQFNVLYDSRGRVSEIRSVDGSDTGDAIVYAYIGKTQQLASISTRENGVLKTQVSYGYDAYGRLAWVQTDLTPGNAEDNRWDDVDARHNDGRLFRTTYDYVEADASDLRIARVTGSDGTTAAYTYKEDGLGGFRINSVTEGGDDGSARTLTFDYGDDATDVIDNAGRTWTYQYDSEKRLIAVLEPAVNGMRARTAYEYDTAGNVTRITGNAMADDFSTEAGLDVVFTYDANGNRILQRDLLGNTSAWTYNGRNQVLTETRYTVADADGLDPAHVGNTNLPGGALTTQYIYDAQDRLRFMVNAGGEVRELNYASSGNGIGELASERRYLSAVYVGAYNEAALQSWASDTVAMRRAASSLTTYAYDAKGRLQQTVEYANVSNDAAGTGVLDVGAFITRYTHDAQGQLLQKIVSRGAARSDSSTLAGSEVTEYVYDGMGRLLSALSRDASSAAGIDVLTVQSTYAYVDSRSQIRVTLDTGLIRTEARNQAGDILSISEVGSVGGGTVTRTTRNFYDNTGRLRGSQDAAGGRTYFFYDDSGRLIATVDPTGAVARMIYDELGRKVETIVMENRVDTPTWLVNGAVVKSELVFDGDPATLAGHQAWVEYGNDRSTYYAYDEAGRLATTTDAAGLVTSYLYDGASRLLQISQTKPGIFYFKAVSNRPPSASEVRTTRFFYDNADRLIATLDPEGFLVESIYDAGGRLIRTTRYAARTNSVYWSSGTLDELRPINIGDDQSTRYFYDVRGRQIGALNAEGYLTESLHDEASNQRAIKAYANRLTGLTGSETLSELRTAATATASSEVFRLTQNSFNGLGQLTASLNHEGIVTRYNYDEAGRLVKTEAAQGTTEVREGNRRYDVFGNLIGELSGEGAVQVLAGMTEAQLDAVYASYGVRHSYDLLGRRIESTDAPGNKTWMFYDANGRQTFTVRGVEDSASIRNAQGEVSETRYTAFGEVADTIAYTGRITIAIPGNRNSAQSAISTLQYIAAQDSRTQYAYDIMGHLVSQTDAEGHTTGYSYNSFGDLASINRYSSSGPSRSTAYAYDRRGLRTRQTDSTSGLTRSVNNTYDAFGRVTRQVDARGTIRDLAYDRLGRQVSTTTRGVSGQDLVQSSTYDVFDRVLTQTDATGRTTTYAYSDSARSVTVTSPEGVIITTLQNRFGQTVEVRQPQPGGTMAVTTSTYDRNGNLTQRTDPLGNTASNVYDVRGQLIASADATGRQVSYRYDAAGRILTRVEDPGVGKLNLTTRYVFDGQGRAMQVTDASGRVSAMRYDRKGNLIQLALDPTGLNLRTTYTWDESGRQLSVIEGSGTAAARQTVYAYDGFGRRISETVGTGSAQVATHYEYDANDNVVRKSGVGGTVQFAYDAGNRLRFTVDAIGGLTEQVYDRTGRVTAQRSYAKAVNLSSLGTTVPSEAQLGGFVDAQALRDDMQDLTTYQVYDGDGRIRLSIDGTGGVIESVYDSIGRRIADKRYVSALPLSVALRGSLAAGTATIASLLAATPQNAQTDSVVRFFYDANDRLVYSVDGNGGMTRMWYDAAGRIVSTRQFAQPAYALATATVASLDSQIDLSQGYEGESRVYDGAGRLRFMLAADGVLRETRYDTAGNVVSSLRYFVSASAFQSANENALQNGTAQVADFAAFVTANEATAASSHSVYDAASRQRLRITNTSATQAAVVEQQYDAAGRMVGAYAYTTLLTVDATLSAALSQGSATEASLSTWLSANRGTAQIQRMVYDAAGRVAYSIDGAGAVTNTRYNPLGMIASVRQHAQAVTLNLNGTTLDAATVASALVDTMQDRVDYSVYDAAARVVFRVHADASTEEIRYDAIGRVRTTFAYAATLDATLMGQVAAGTATAASFATHVTANEAAARAEGLHYDQAGRVRYQVVRSGSGVGQVTETQYDAIGRQIAKTRYGVDIGYAPGATNAAIATSVTAALSTDATVRATQIRSVRYFYDAANRQRFALDPSGALSEQRFDAIGRVIQTIMYGTRPGSAADTAALTTWVATQPASGYRTISMAYDLAGQVTSRTDALGQSEFFQYDAAGNITRHTDRAGAVWNYEYDRAGRRTAEISPTVIVQTSTSYAVRSIVTRMEYNGVNNLVRRIENADTSETRITRYEYDNRGNTVRIVLPDPVSGLDPVSGSADTIEIAYDNLGQVVSEKDALGNRSYKVYDTLGRVIYDIDQEQQVTSHLYNAFGEEIRSVRHANTLNTAAAAFGAAGWAPGQALTQALMTAGLPLSTTDRGVDSSYNVLGQKEQVQQDAVNYVKSDGSVATGRPTLRSQFNAYGEVVKTSILLEGTPDQVDAVWADTYRYYDVLGRETISVDAEGYVNSQTYTVYNEVQTKIEHARRLASAVLSTLGTVLPPTLPTAGDAVTGYDRRVDFIYDALGRIITQTVKHWSQPSSASTATLIDVSTQFGYDAEGRVSSVVDAQGTTTTRYDALGRTISLQQPARAVVTTQSNVQLMLSLSTNLTSAALYEQRSPYTELAYDAFGNAVRVQRYANGRVGNAAVLEDVDADQTVVTEYDRRGRITLERDLATGSITQRSYDAEDRVLSINTTMRGRKTVDLSANVNSQLTTRYTYDKTGRQLSSAMVRERYHVVGNVSELKGVSTDASEIVRYNAFGEVIGKDDRLTDAFVGTSFAAYEYDNVGRMVRTNSQGGAWRDYSYDLAGRTTRTAQTSFTVNAQGVQSVLTAVTNLRYDKLGRTIRQELPSNSDDLNQRPVIVREYDRWGNVIRNVDARGYETLVRYNSQNRQVMEIRPEVKVVNANGTEIRTRPVLAWYYDAYGRLTESRDANGNSQRVVYDNVGRAVQSIDALGNATRMAYDLSDHERYTQNALGYITYKEYDRGGRVVSHGDFVDQQGTRGMRPMEFYGVESSGDRWEVHNALNFSAYYDYDSRHLLLGSRSAAGVIKTYAHDLQGRKIRESNGDPSRWRYLLGLDNSGSTINGYGTGQLVDMGHWEGGGYYEDDSSVYWVSNWMYVPTVQYPGSNVFRDRDGESVFENDQTWDYDFFGRLIDHNDLGGADYDYIYHSVTGQLIRTTIASSTKLNVALIDMNVDPNAQIPENVSGSATTESQLPTNVGTNERVQFYYASGLIKEIREGSNWTRYSYDESGNRVMEETYTHDGKGNLVHLRTVSTYDSQGRLSLVRQFDMAHGYEFATVRYSYDAAGNRRRVSVGNAGSNANTGTSAGWGFTGYANRAISVNYGYSVASLAPETTFQMSMTLADGSPLPSWLSFDPATGIVSGTPPAAQVLALRLTARSIDDNSVVIRNIAVQILPSQPPQLTFIGDDSWEQTLTLGQANWTFSTASAFMDPEGLPLQYSAMLRVGTGLQPLQPLPAGMQINAATGVISGVPAQGVYQIVVTATDTDNQSVNKTLMLAVEPWQITAFEDETFDVYLPDAFDLRNGQPPSGYTIVSVNNAAVPSWLQLQQYSPGDWYLSGTPTGFGLRNIKLRATYADGSIAEKTLTLDVKKINDGDLDPYLAINKYDDSAISNEFKQQDSLDTVDTTIATVQLLDVPIIDDGEGGGGGGGGGGGSYTPVTPGAGYVYASSNFKSFWYDYDALNRVTVVNGKLENGAIVLGVTTTYEKDISYALDYDEAGREIRRRFLEAGVNKYENTQYNERGQRTIVFKPAALGATPQVAEVLAYDAAGRLTSRMQPFEASHEYAGQAKRREEYAYDADGRQLTQVTIEGFKQRYHPAGVPIYIPVYRYATAERSSVDYTYDYSRDGRLTQNRYHHHSDFTGESSGLGYYGFVYTYTYDAREAYLETRVNAYGTANFQPGSTSSVYDGWGRRVAVQDGKERLFAYDASSNIIQRKDNNGNFPITRYAHVSGQQVAASAGGYIDVVSNLTAYRNSESGSSSITVQGGDTLRSIAQRIYGNESLWYVLASANALDGSETLTSGTTLKVPDVKVNKNDAETFKPFNPSEVIGSTTPSLDYVQPPPPKKSCSALQIILTIVVVIIVAVVTIYTAGAAAPAGTAAVVAVGGSTAAATGTFAVGAAVLAGTATGISVGATLAVAAVAGAVGAFAGQLASLAFGLTDEFDWGAVALGAVSSAATAGIGSALSGGAQGAKAVAAAKTAGDKLTTANVGFFNANLWAKGAAQAVSGNLVNYGSNWAMNRIDSSRDRSNEKFNWANLAASAVSGAVTAELGNWLGGKSDAAEWIRKQPLTSNSYVREILTGTATGFIGSAVQHNVASLLGEDGAPDYGQMVTDAFGNALAEATKRALTTIEPRRSIKELRRTEEYKQLNAKERELAKSLYRDEYLNLDLKKEGTLQALVGAVKASQSDNIQTRIAATRDLLFASGLNAEQVGVILRIQKDALGVPHVNDSDKVDANPSDPNADKIAANIGLSDVDIKGTRSAKGEVLWRPVDKAFIAIGGVAVAVGNFMEEYPWIGAALSTLDVIASPQMALLREAADRFGLLKPIEDATAAISREISERFVDAGYSQESSVAGTAGVVVGIGLIAFGAKAAIKNWTSVYRMVDNVAAKAVQLKSKLTSFINRTKPSNAIAPPESPKFYSVAYQAQLDEVDFNKSPATHTSRLNKSLFKSMEGDPRFADQMEELMPGVKENMRMNKLGKVQDGHRAHHAHSLTADGNYGVMEYVPKQQHTKGSGYWDLMHPGANSSGGYKELELLFGAKKR